MLLLFEENHAITVFFFNAKYSSYIKLSSITSRVFFFDNLKYHDRSVSSFSPKYTSHLTWLLIISRVFFLRNVKYPIYSCQN